MYNFDACTCRTRIYSLHVVIDDLPSISKPFLNNVEEILHRFERTYTHLQSFCGFYEIQNGMILFCRQYLDVIAEILVIRRTIAEAFGETFLF